MLSEILLYAKPQVLQLCELDINKFLRELLVPIREMPEALERQIKFIPAPEHIYSPDFIYLFAKKILEFVFKVFN